MNIHYTLDDSAARLPLLIRSAEGVQDRAVDLRNAPGVHLVELTTQHMLNTGSTLLDELTYYFDHEGPSETDPYALTACYADHAALEDLWQRLLDRGAGLTAFDEVERLFPASFQHALPVTLALTVVGVPAFGYVRALHDSEGDEYHGLVINLARARPHLEEGTGQFSLSLLVDTIRYGLFNHEIFRLAYSEFCHATGRATDRLADRLKHALLSRGIAWYLSYRHDLPFYDALLGWNPAGIGAQVKRWNALIADAGTRRALDDGPDDWLRDRTAGEPGETTLDVVGYHAVRALVEDGGEDALAEAVAQGPDRFITRYNALGEHRLRAGG